LKDLFRNAGEVLSANIILDRETGRSRGFGFVEMLDNTQAKAAIDGLNGKELKGRNVIVNEARPRTEGRSGGGSRGYRFEGHRRSGGRDNRRF